VDIVAFPSGWLMAGIAIVQAVVFIMLVAIGAWLAIRFEKWRSNRF
jgi:hypothetical protein